MKQITTRELVHQTRRVRELLERGETLQWTQRGRVVAVLRSPNRIGEEPEQLNWLDRARSSGAVARGGESVASLIDKDRGE